MILSAPLALQFCENFVCKGSDEVQYFILLYYCLSSQDLTARIFLSVRSCIAF